MLVPIDSAKAELCHYENTPIQNVLKISPPKNKFSDENSDFFHISA